ncbi:septal ring lytic transglycosylase RlpA family protein [Sphingobacterium litopenaei]|uniref:LysM peptidoglycan-binding domain-containing protein n=1 Tax=Sphingobacterium litopenaei TaxID=2763500 RepID=A0ABR7YHY8_9SPHI|nr:LysM peptidoglycan-binding domain-containing protein [Sphingobacterium litopenaei]MBD1430895.1 LysM peptidoglycan-binding domain-containing protein [Sphingobacterium litopenaei]
MNQRKTIKTYHKLTFLFVFGLSIPALGNAKSMDLTVNTTLEIRLDSVGTENINGKRYVIHKLAAKETYYQLSRIYGVPVNEIMEANNKKSLRIGDLVRIPRGAAIETRPTLPTSSSNNTTSTKKNNAPVLINPNDITEYKVGKSETLFAISRRFGISVPDIKRMNNLTSDSLREGQILKIPNHALPVEVPEVVQIQPIQDEIEENNPIDDSAFKPNRYGIRETKEKGVGVWLNDLESDDHTSLALHKSAPIGTILKITNPMNRSVTFAKVVGKFNDNHDTQGAIVILSKSVASSIGILDKRFQVEITYGVPLN